MKNENNNKIAEVWLNKLSARLNPLFEKGGNTIPTDVKLHCGWTSKGAGRSAKHQVLGECFSRSCSAKGVNEIFISPVRADSLRVADVLVHELCHAIDDCQDGHGSKFRSIATGVGLTGKMTATVASPELEEKLKAIIADIGEYPQSELTAPEKKQSTRMLKMVCENDCGASCYQSAKQSSDNPMLCSNCSDTCNDDGYTVNVYMVQA
tara:strand:+ start:206 stop:829 length:624 start_codon:yes stop_codon:yes gene_type:complete